jgi:hypothetical protein
MLFDTSDVAKVIINKELADKLVLCYIEGDSIAYFTTDLENTSGDDWNDAPYEHNASRPYNVYSDEGGVLYHVMFYADLETPATGKLNSWVSVDTINSKEVPWLKTPVWFNEESSLKIYAGTTLTEFVCLITEYGGSVYFEGGLL